MDIQTVPIELLHFDPANTRQHDEKNLNAIKASLARYKQVEPLIVQKSTNVVIGGNGRLEVMKSLGYTHVDVNFLDVSNVEAGALSVILNRSSELGSWNKELLGSHLQGLREDGWELEELGFELEDIGDLQDFGEPTGEPPEEFVPSNEMSEELSIDKEYAVLIFDDKAQLNAFKEKYGYPEKISFWLSPTKRTEEWCYDGPNRVLDGKVML